MEQNYKWTHSKCENLRECQQYGKSNTASSKELSYEIKYERLLKGNDVRVKNCRNANGEKNENNIDSIKEENYKMEKDYRK